MSGKLDITIEQGATFSRVLTITDSTSTPINIANDTFRGQVRSSFKSAIVQATFSFAFHTDGTDGKIAILLSDEATSLIESGKNFVYDIEWVKQSGEVTRLLEGTATITAEVTR